MYRTKVFAQMAGVGLKTLRYYERLGLLTPTRTAAGHRRYSNDDLRRLQCVLALRSLRLPLGEIRGVLRSDQIRLGEHVTFLRRERAAIDRAIAAAQGVDADESPRAALDLFAAEEAWARWESLRQVRQVHAQRAPDRAPASRLAMFRAISDALDSGGSAAGDRAVDCWRAATDPDMLRAWRSRARWPPAMRAYVASLFDTTAEAWERVAAAIDARRQR